MKSGWWFVAPTGSLLSEDAAVVLPFSGARANHVAKDRRLAETDPREDSGATLHGLARYQGEADPLVEL